MIGIIILAALVKLNLAIHKPILPAVIFAISSSLIGLMFGHPFMVVAISGVINFGLAFLYFWLLKRTEGQGTWWVVLILGIAVIAGLSALG